MLEKIFLLLLLVLTAALAAVGFFAYNRDATLRQTRIELASTQAQLQTAHATLEQVRIEYAEQQTRLSNARNTNRRAQRQTERVVLKVQSDPSLSGEDAEQAAVRIIKTELGENW
jgi:hypothetical protein